MDVFNLRNALIEDYATYIKSFIRIQDEPISRKVQEEMRQGVLWPDPLIQLNPNFEPGRWIDDFVVDGALHPLAKEIFRIDKDGGDEGKPMRLHRHQSDAVDAARSGDNYVLTTGTGSGKSLAYIVPIVDHVLRRGSGNGVQAVIVYPMNALANSQVNELDKFLKHGFDRPPVTYERYTGQESEDDRERIIANPPDIILTNYVMLELMLTRPRERRLIEAMRGLQFLVLDELHTYRGRQGADVAMLVRRVRDICQSPRIQLIGTSATLAEGGKFADQQRKIAEVATQLFGSEVKPKRIIGETLLRATSDIDLEDSAFIEQLTRRVSDPGQLPSQDYETFVTDPLSVWIESTFGLTTEEGGDRLKRADPISITGEKGAAAKLAEVTGQSHDRCAKVIEQGLLAGYKVQQKDTPFPVFAFRLHQFISRGDTVYASLEAPSKRHITLNGQKFVPGDRQKILLPVAFCRACGQEYYVVNRIIDYQTNLAVFSPRELSEQTREENRDHGFLYANEDNPWPEELNTQIEEERLPEDWLEPYKDTMRVKHSQRKKLPQVVQVNTLGEEDEGGIRYQFVRSPFQFLPQLRRRLWWPREIGFCKTDHFVFGRAQHGYHGTKSFGITRVATGRDP